MLPYLWLLSSAPLIAIGTSTKIDMLQICILPIKILRATTLSLSPCLQLEIHWDSFTIFFALPHLVMCTFHSLYPPLRTLPLPPSKFPPSMGWISFPRNNIYPHLLLLGNSSKIIAFMKKQNIIRYRVQKLLLLWLKQSPKLSILLFPHLYASATFRYCSAILELLPLLFMIWLSLIISNPMWSVPSDHLSIQPPSAFPRRLPALSCRNWPMHHHWYCWHEHNPMSYPLFAGS